MGIYRIEFVAEDENEGGEVEISFLLDAESFEEAGRVAEKRCPEDYSEVEYSRNGRKIDGKKPSLVNVQPTAVEFVE